MLLNLSCRCKGQYHKTMGSELQPSLLKQPLVKPTLIELLRLLGLPALFLLVSGPRQLIHEPPMLLWEPRFLETPRLLEMLRHFPVDVRCLRLGG